MSHELMIPAQKRPELNADMGLRPLNLQRDITVIHPWYQMDYAHYWNMQNMTPEETRAFYQEAAVKSHLQAFMGFHRNEPAFVMECYDPDRDEIAKHYDVLPGDIGMHFFVGPATRPIHNFTRDVLRTLVAFLFDELSAQRVVVEPDIRNTQVHRLNETVGFKTAGSLQLPGKTALLAFCSSTDFEHSLKG
ncbi:GNAT family N-acetyltransferase [Brenneria corticis]|uniref:N-acetyltransferase n=1 Tax=Brenneria corticis TaxID=2173106 RepID=A0A2U1U336_9GAMM|nr:GNAT family N-acetyltransferase [Brenneria sp. CFCC 11842]PWC16068.1 N-acetyltransferase [Brenneria sp. CFCC 11842]